MRAAWYLSLCVLADHQVLAHWRMTSGAAFWWTLTDRSQLQPNGFRDEPFLFSDIVTVTIYRDARVDREAFNFEWAKVNEVLQSIPGMRVTRLAGVRPWPSNPPTDALELAATESEPAPPVDGGRDTDSL